MSKDPFELVAQLGLDLGCLVCPGRSELKRYGGWRALLHEIGHFAIVPPFLRNFEAHRIAAEANERAPVPDGAALAIGFDFDGELIPEGIALCELDGTRRSYVAMIAENPRPLTDWHVRAWEAVACHLLDLPISGNMWLRTSPWGELLSSAYCGHWGGRRPPGWEQRHPERVALWEERLRARADEDQELRWRLEDLEDAGKLKPLRLAVALRAGLSGC